LSLDGQLGQRDCRGRQFDCLVTAPELGRSLFEFAKIGKNLTTQEMNGRSSPFFAIGPERLAHAARLAGGKSHLHSFDKLIAVLERFLEILTRVAVAQKGNKLRQGLEIAFVYSHESFSVGDRTIAVTQLHAELKDFPLDIGAAIV